jgi:hypothetical protein
MPIHLSPDNHIFQNTSLLPQGVQIEEGYTLPVVMSLTHPQDYLVASFDFFCKDNLVKVFTDEKVGDVYTDTLIEEDLEGVYSYGKRHGFYVKGPDSSLRTYQLDIPFVDQKVPYVTWSDSKVNSQEYMYQAIGGCGSNNFRDVAKVKFEDLKQIVYGHVYWAVTFRYNNKCLKCLKS